MTRLLCWNVNGIRAIHGKGFLEWLAKESPDILCIQESKAHPEQLGNELLHPEGYEVYWESAEKKGYSGVACFCKKKPEEVEIMGVEDFDREGRVQLLRFTDFTLINAYFPNSQEAGRRLDYKVAFCDAMLGLCQREVKAGNRLVLCGDYNIAHKAIDLANPEANTKNPGYLPEERAWMDKFTSEGFVDTFRMFDEEGENYTWWSYRTRARVRNAGWRIDYHCVSENLRPMVQKASILSDVMGSDHCPVELVLSI